MNILHYNSYIITIVTILFISIKNSLSFIAYSCSGPKLNITAFNTLSVDYCHVPPPSQITKIQTIKLLQRAESHTIPFKACYILADYFVSRCSYFNDAQIVKDGYFSEVIDLSPVQCADIHQKLYYQISNNILISNLKINQTKYFSTVIAGNVGADGSCEGSSYNTDKNSYKDVVVQAKFKILISTGIAIASFKEDLFISPSGTRFKLSNYFGIDTIYGHIIWDHDEPTNDNCNTKDYDVLYEGPADLVISKRPNEEEETHTYIVQTDKIAFALRKTGLTYICSIEMISTEHVRLVILEDQMYMPNFQSRQISVFNTDLVAYLNTKFVYIEHFLSSSITAMYKDLVVKQCNLERQILKQKLAIASYSLTEFAYAMSDSPGYAALRSGEIVYLLKCKPVEVQLAKTDHCFDELPVIFENSTRYLSPKNHIILNHGTEIDCSELMPSAYLIENTWFSLNPYFREIHPPQTLAPETAFTWQYKSPEFLMNAGLYSKENMNSFQRQLLFPQEIISAQSNIARETLGYNILDQGLRFKTLIDEITINKLVENKLEKIYGWFLWFGNCVSGLLGIFFITKLILTCLNTLVNLTILYNTFGWSVKLLAGIFSSITQYIMHKNHTENFSKPKDYKHPSSPPFTETKENINSIEFEFLTKPKPYDVIYSEPNKANKVYPQLHQNIHHSRKPSL